MARYAEGTTVTAEASRGEITGILAKHGVERMAWSSGPEGDQLLFELGGGSYRLTMSKLSPAALQERDGDRYTYPHNIDWVARGPRRVEAQKAWGDYSSPKAHAPTREQQVTITSKAIQMARAK